MNNLTIDNADWCHLANHFANIQNFIQRSGLWVSVDWENSGWVDPSFDIAGLMAHPAFLEVHASLQEWLVELYAQIVVDSTISTRFFLTIKSCFSGG